MTIARDVLIANRYPRLQFSRAAITKLIQTLDAQHAAIGLRRSAIPVGELSVVFLTDAALAGLHADFLADPTTTDVITFEGDRAHGTAGEICVSVDTARTYAAEHRREFAEELTLYIVHGWLHLAGHDDLVPAKKRAMRRAEGRALQVLQEQRAVPDFRVKAKRAKRYHLGRKRR